MNLVYSLKLSLLAVLMLSNNTHATTSIALVGDSITSGWPEIPCARGRQSFGGYAPYLEDLLNDADWPSKVYNYGIAGDRAQWATVEFNKWCTKETWVFNGALIKHNQIEVALSGPEPRYMLYLFGTNDLALHSAATVASYIEVAINDMLEGGTIPIVGTILPDFSSHGDVKDITGANALIRDLLEEKNVQLAELYAATSLYGWVKLMQDDGLHPKTSGRQFMAEVWHEALLEKRTKITAGAQSGINLMLLLSD